jgi:hypothetical protein
MQQEMSRFQHMFEESIEKSGYRISPRMPLKYRVARFLQRMYNDTRGISLGDNCASILASMLPLSVNAGFMSNLEFYKPVEGVPHKRHVTRLRAYPNGGVSVAEYVETLPHHPMRLRSHARREAEEAAAEV